MRQTQQCRIPNHEFAKKRFSTDIQKREKDGPKSFVLIAILQHYQICIGKGNELKLDEGYVYNQSIVRFQHKAGRDKSIPRAFTMAKTCKIINPSYTKTPRGQTPWYEDLHQRREGSKRRPQLWQMIFIITSSYIADRQMQCHSNKSCRWKLQNVTTVH